MVGRTNVGGKGINLNVKNYTVLPASGRRNDIALINNVPINNIYIQSGTPSSPSEGDVFFRVGWSGNVYLWYEPIAINLTSCKQYVSGAWVVIPEWYLFQGGVWKRARLYLIQDGQMTGTHAFSARKWKQNSGSSVPSGDTTFNQQANYVYVYQKNTATSAGEYGSAGICTQNFGAGQFSKIFIEMSSSSSYADCERYIAIANYGDSYVRLAPYAYQNITTATSETRTQTTVDITYTDNPCCVYVGMNSRNNGNTSTMKIYTIYLE